MRGTWTVASYTKKVWVFSPWSPRLSPWSAMSTSTVSSQTPAAFSHAIEPAHDLVGVRHLAEVGLALVARGEGLGRLVGGVGVVEVDPGEEGLLLHRLQPGQGEVHHLVPLLLHGAEVDDLVLGQVEVVGVDVEALVEAPARVEHPRPHEGPGRVAGLLHPLRERRLRGVQEEAAVVADAVVRRDEPREDRRVRGQGHRRGGRRLLEQDAVLGHRVDVRRVDPPEAVAAEPVCPQGVEGDHHDVPRLRRRAAKGEPGARLGLVPRGAQVQPEPARERDQGDRDDPHRPCSTRSPAAFRPPAHRRTTLPDAFRPGQLCTGSTPARAAPVNPKRRCKCAGILYASATVRDGLSANALQTQQLLADGASVTGGMSVARQNT